GGHLSARFLELYARRNDARSDWLGQNKRVPGTRAGVSRDLIGGNQSGDSVAEHDLIVVHAVTADQRDSVFIEHSQTAAHDLAEDRIVHVLFRETGDGQRGDWRARHRPNVVDRIERGDAPVIERVVNNGREEVNGLDQRQVVAQTI